MTTITSTNKKLPATRNRLQPAACHHGIDRGHSDHLVQFYEQESVLIDAVAPFIGGALSEGEAGIVIATKSHLAALEDRWRGEGLDLAQARAEGRYFPLDAAETLSAFMVGGTPDMKRFQHTIKPLVQRASRAGRRVRAFGEMVVLLWQQGNGSAAIQLEQLWNDLLKERPFSLLCAYPLQVFRGGHQRKDFVQVCQEHSRVIPAESYTREQGVEARLRAISQLQQKADSLEAEIVERKRAECALRAQQTKLTVAATLAQLGVWELDMVTKEFTGSDLFKTTFGLAAEPLSYQRFCELIHADDAPHVERAFQTAMATGADFSTEFRVVNPTGTLRWVAMMGRAFHNGDHRLLGATLDITERNRAAEILERTVQERTAELRETVGEIEAFSYSISHDMRAPLRSIQGFSKILLEDCADLDPQSRNYLERIAASAQRMDRLIQDVLTFSRVARTELRFEPVNLEHVVRGILECYPQLQPPQAKVTIDGVLPQVHGNAAALTQCLSNLLGNAVKFVPGGTVPEIRIWAEPMAKRVRLNVKDNGIGIPEEHLDRIFGIFQRLHKHYDGTGIGLAIVKKAAERMGGKVGVISKPGEGSTFWLELPAA